MFSFILPFLRTNKATTIAAGIALIFMVINIKQCNTNNRAKQELAVAKHNIDVLSDTLRVTKNRIGQDEYNKLAFLTDKISNLEALSTDLFNEVKKIKGNVSTIIKGDVKIVDRPVPFLVQSEIKDSTIKTDFKFDSTYSPGNYRKLSGYTTYNLRDGQSTGVKQVDEVGIQFVTGIKNLDKGKPEIFLTSDYPGFTVTGLTGAALDPNLFKKKPVPLITVGFGIGWVPITYTISSKEFKITPDQFGVSAGVNVNLIRLLQKK